MNEMLIHKLDRSITLRYWLAVGLIALLSTGAFYFLKSALSGSDSTAYIVNLSGKQRMLSQRISLDVHRVYQFSYIQNKLDNTAKAKEVLAEIKAQLIKHCEVMETANNQLSSGQLKNNRKIKLSHTILQMYFGEMNVYQRVNTFTSLAKQIAKTENQSIAEQLMGQIDKDSELLLNDLNSVVSQYQKEGEKHLKSIAQMELFVWLITLAVLGLEVILIFRPMVKHLINAKQAEERTMDNLKGLVELRTLKLENSNEQLRKIAQHDPLTGLRNRLTLETDIEVLAENFNKHRSPFAVAMLDIDWFKKVNDSYGHDAGDYVLKEFAKILTELSRDYDKIYRAGGEEFMIVLNRISLDAVYSKLEKMRLRIQDYPFSFDGHSISITSSFGFYHTDLSFSSNVHNIIKLTDKALYKSKSLGRNRVTIAKIGKEHQLIAHTPARTQIIYTDDSLSSLIHIDKSIESLRVLFPAACGVQYMDESIST